MAEHVFSASPYERLYGFCRAVRIGDRIEVSGTAPIPQDGSATPERAFDQMVLCGDIAVEALRALGGSVDDVVRTRMFITSADDQEEIGRAHQRGLGAQLVEAVEHQHALTALFQQSMQRIVEMVTNLKQHV